jgi:hypothetical protein
MKLEKVKQTPPIRQSNYKENAIVHTFKEVQDS